MQLEKVTNHDLNHNCFLHSFETRVTSNFIVVIVFGIQPRLLLSQLLGFDGRCKGRVPVSASTKSGVPVNLQCKQSSYIVIFFLFS